MLGISLTTLHQRRCEGAAPDPLPMPGHPRWSRDTVERFLANDAQATRGRRRRS